MVIVFYILRALSFLVIADALLSWVQRDTNAFPRKLTHAITQPMYAPIHAILDPRKTGGIDFSPLVMIFLLNWLAQTLAGAM